MEKKSVKLYAPVVETIWGVIATIGLCSFILM
ncbi:hypothetical protein SAMN05720468_10391 [Fibrobacter sp. UWEL]|nr:hypothetical protein SAMN05720468_10391 [Fibrobacter sp. UWEL]